MGGYLTDRKLMNITEPGDYTDGPDAKGLKARARRLSNDDLSIRWVQRVYIKDPDAKDPDTAKTIRSKDVGLGVYPKVSLTEARRIADANQALGDQGIDPRSKKVDKARIPTFDEMALEVFDADCERHASGQLRASTLRRKRSNLNRHIMPAFPGRPIDKIEMGDIENMMAPIYKTKRPTFNRVWSFTKAMFDLAIVRTPLEFNPVNNSVLTALKALGRNSHQEDHYESVPYPRVAQAMGVIDKKTPEPRSLSTKLGLFFTILTGCRTSEARLMTWDQLRSKKIEMSADWGEGVKIRKDKTLDYGGWKVLDWNEYEQDDSRTVIWIIPPGIAKMGKTHRIPLSTAALNILREARTLHERWGSPYVFPSSQGPHGPLHSTTMANRCQILGIDGTPHGFRTSFRNWCEEQGVPDNPSEIALAHELDKVKRSYLRSDLLAIRSTVMEYWAQYLRGDLPDDWEWTTPAATAQIKELNDKLDRLMQLHEATQERAQAAELENAALRAELNTLRALQPALGL